MRKAHEAELEKERGKFLGVIAKTYCQADIESLQRQHEWAPTCISFCTAFQSRQNESQDKTLVNLWQPEAGLVKKIDS